MTQGGLRVSLEHGAVTAHDSYSANQVQDRPPTVSPSRAMSIFPSVEARGSCRSRANEAILTSGTHYRNAQGTPPGFGLASLGARTGQEGNVHRVVVLAARAVLSVCLAAALTVVGCGGSASVPTVTQTHTISNQGPLVQVELVVRGGSRPDFSDTCYAASTCGRATCETVLRGRRATSRPGSRPP